MQQRNRIVVGFVVLLVVIVGWWRQYAHWQIPVPFRQLEDGQIVQAQLKGQELAIEVVSSPESIAQGLSGRSQIGSDGMLFVFDRTGFPVFWMKDMLFDLDFVWLQDYKVVAITHTVPHPQPGTPETELPTYPAPAPANQVLEINAGSARAWDIAVGDQLEIK